MRLWGTCSCCSPSIPVTFDHLSLRFNTWHDFNTGFSRFCSTRCVAVRCLVLVSRCAMVCLVIDSNHRQMSVQEFGLHTETTWKQLGNDSEQIFRDALQTTLKRLSTAFWDALHECSHMQSAYQVSFQCPLSTKLMIFQCLHFALFLIKAVAVPIPTLALERRCSKRSTKQRRTPQGHQWDISSFHLRQGTSRIWFPRSRRWKTACTATQFTSVQS